ncbi:alpha 1,2 mannosyltransferase [Microbotryomycetes sp. JL201]|nr:alpha 1,2 mannosyltransferase [Microbotryomycetes sp. JL201]
MKLGLDRHRTTWLCAAIVRLLIAISSTSTIHPDEHFQNPEIAAGFVFDHVGSAGHLLETWEWQGDRPCRSIVPVLGSSGMAFGLLKTIVGTSPSARQLFLAQRIFMWLTSLLIDYAVATLAPARRMSLILLATSPITLTFLVRPFSNALETVILALALVCYNKWSLTRQRTPLMCLASLASLGVFTRITFMAFVSPIAAVLLATLVPQLFKIAEWSCWLLHSIIFVATFGYLHQGGLVPTIVMLNDMLRNGTLSDFDLAGKTVNLVFWRTFMPPRHLTLPLKQTSARSVHEIIVFDLAGAPSDKLWNLLDKLTGPATFLIAPRSAIGKVLATLSDRGRDIRLSLIPGQSSALHLDMDRLDEFLLAANGQKSLGIWNVQYQM